jgi:hypothetical protein
MQAALLARREALRGVSDGLQPGQERAAQEAGVNGIEERIAEVLGRAQAFGGPESLNEDNLADLVVAELGLKQQKRTTIGSKNGWADHPGTKQGDVMVRFITDWLRAE